MIRQIAAAMAALALVGAPTAVADTTDQQFLDLIHANNVPGQDDSLIAFAHEYCDGNGTSTILPLIGQGVTPNQFYTVRVAASRVYCPMKIAQPNHPAPVFTGLVP
ncbi:hypothetical protein Y900_025465 [Mycolicibacterium aromaticivorans JS19b1 = JCM 16368]|uniref:DUF732 domain-containing protein n=1 Tax=Mycolicibacterium aromaticivorans JS19b1 = JCM 16368 TaxID=1440774 RepID=A0A064CTZ3_9MYCO|nr:DUF732 domain-containing protein [Mycolicibacterium aromaticivorans]KDF02189.1 hypothetical protein Y900_025465 [Mycolicibacterium aromaticivorans JS19b1 = JCM 16368]